MSNNKKLLDYIGDGVYVEFDGYSVWLLANDHKDPTDKICLEPEVLEAFNRFLVRCSEVRKEYNEQQKAKSLPSV